VTYNGTSLITGTSRAKREAACSWHTDLDTLFD